VESYCGFNSNIENPSFPLSFSCQSASNSTDPSTAVYRVTASGSTRSTGQLGITAPAVVSEKQRRPDPISNQPFPATESTAYFCHPAEGIPADDLRRPLARGCPAHLRQLSAGRDLRRWRTPVRLRDMSYHAAVRSVSFSFEFIFDAEVGQTSASWLSL
jgi:hypothetical protein